MNYWFLYKSDGSIYERPYFGPANEWQTIPTDCVGVLGPLPDTDATAVDAGNYPTHYNVQNGKLVSIVTSTQLLSEAQQNQIALINAGYQQTINAGFQCEIGTATYTFGWQQDSAHNDQLHLSQVQQAIDKGIDTFPVPYADINGNTVNIPDQTTLTALDTKANSFGWSQIKQRRTLIGQIQTATTVSAVQAVVWIPGTY